MNIKLSFYNLMLPQVNQQKKEIEIVDLGDIMTPEDVEFSFDTMGWKVLFSITAIAIILIIIRYFIQYIQNKYRRKALIELNNFVAENQNNEIVNFSNVLLKKTSILIYGRAQTANLHGEKWAEFLDSKTEKTNFQDASYIFSKASYMTKEIPNDERDLIINLTKKWIQTHA